MAGQAHADAGQAQLVQGTGLRGCTLAWWNRFLKNLKKSKNSPSQSSTRKLDKIPILSKKFYQDCNLLWIKEIKYNKNAPLPCHAHFTCYTFNTFNHLTSIKVSCTLRND